jgi:hypothetical protein
MPASAALPPSLYRKIHSLARRVRIVRALRGGGLLLVALVVPMGAALLTDYGFGLPSSVRLALLLSWGVLGIALAVRGIVLPFCRKLSPEGLAALIEERYPDLGERLTSAVELAGSQANYHGSPALVSLLIEEAETHTRSLNVFEAVPARGAIRLAGAAVLLLFLAGSCALVWPRYSLELGRRFLVPWRTPGTLVLYSLEVAPGDTMAAKGRPLAFSVTIVPEQANVSLPKAGALVRTDAVGNISRQPLLSTRPDVFSFVLDKVTGNFRYSVEAGGAISDTYQVIAIEPVELAADSPTIRITPPLYAKNSIEDQTIHGLTDLNVLQHSRIRLDFRFTQPAQRATLEWPAPAAEDNGATRIPRNEVPLVLTADRYGASCELPALAGGSYRLVLEEEHGIRTELEPRLLKVHVDQPPAFRRLVINDKVYVGPEEDVKPAPKPSHERTPREDTKTVVPSESLRVDIGLRDDIGVERAEIEYRVNEGTLQRETIRLQTAGSPEANGQFLFQLAGKRLREGDTLRYRMRATDNRNVPEAGLGPNVMYYPPDERWLALEIDAKAQPLRQQEISGQRDDIDRRLEEIKAGLLSEQRDLERLQSEARQQTLLGEEQAKQLKLLREQNRQTENALRELARVAAGIRPLQMLADQGRQVADQQMRRSDEALQQAGQESQPQPRDQRFGESDKEIASALSHVEAMRRANAELAQARMDLAQLEGLADRQQQLAERASSEVVKEPGNPNRDQKLKGDQKEIASDLQRLAGESESIRKALDAARAEEARELAANARELAQAERDLLDAERQTQQREKAARLTEIARKQEELAQRTNQLAKGTRSMTQAAAATPLRPEAASQAVQALREDNSGEALRFQHQNREELERLAKELDQAAERAREPREAARQLARLQEALRQSINEEGSKEPLKGEHLDAARREQEALRRAVENLQLPAQDPSVEKQQREAVERTIQALEALEDHDARHAEVRMAQAEEALRQLAEQIPPGPPPQNEKAASHPPPTTVRGQAPEPTPVLEGLPSHEQAREIRELAEQQGELIEAVQDLVSQKMQAKRGLRESPLRELSREQREVARQAAELARAVGLEDGQQAAAALQSQQASQSAQDASRYLQAGAVQRAYQAGTRTAQELRELADQLSQTPGRSGNARSSDRPEQARRLNQRQEEINRRLAELTTNSEAQQAQQQARQQELQQQTNELSQDLNQLAQQMADSPLAQLSAQRAAESGQQAQTAMEQARDSDHQGNERRAQQARQEAARDLDQAAGQSELAAQQMIAALDLPHQQSNPEQSRNQPGQALQQAQQQMTQAEAQLGQGRHPAALQAMQRAALALQRAAQQLAQGGQPNSTDQTNGRGISAVGRFDPKLFGSDAKEYAGKRWGELPGELRTKIIQDMQAQYGDDYARIIKLYFEQIADTRK